MNENHPHDRLPVLVTAWVLTLAFLCAAAPVSAQGLRYTGWGLRGGFSLTPDQFVLGMHAHLGEFAPNLRFDPNVDIGFGDNVTVFTLNPDITYGFKIQNAGTFYVGGDIGLVITRVDVEEFDSGHPEGFRHHDHETNLGVAVVTGYEFPGAYRPLALDLKVGLSDWYPDLKVMLCYTFPR